MRRIREVLLSEKENERLADYLIECIHNGQRAKGDLPQRWAQQIKLYRNDPDSVSIPKRWQGSSAVSVPISGPRIDMFSASLAGSILSADPYFKAKGWGRAADYAPIVERALQILIQNSNYAITLRKVIRNAAICGNGIFRVSWNVARNDVLESGRTRGRKRLPGFHFESIHPIHCVVDNASFSNINDVHLMGHRFYKRKQDVIEAMRWAIPSEPTIKELPEDSFIIKKIKEASNASFEKIDLHDLQVEVPGGYGQSENEKGVFNEVLEFWQVLFKYNFGDGFQQYYLATVSEDARVVISLDVYPFSYPWFYFMSFDVDEENRGMWASNSIAYQLQGTHQMINRLFNDFVNASDMNSFPPIIAKGNLSRFGGKKTVYAPGEIIPGDNVMSIEPLLGRGDPSVYPTSVNMFYDIADSSVKIPRTSIGGQLRPNATATEASILESSKRVVLDDAYSVFSSYHLEMIEHLLDMMKLHFDEISLFYEDGLGGLIPDALDYFYDWTVSGQKPIRSAESMQSYVVMLAELAKDPSFGLNPKEVGRLAALHSPFNNSEKLVYSEEDMAMAMAKANEMTEAVSGQTMPNTPTWAQGL